MLSLWLCKYEKSLSSYPLFHSLNQSFHLTPEQTPFKTPILHLLSFLNIALSPWLLPSVLKSQRSDLVIWAVSSFGWEFVTHYMCVCDPIWDYECASGVQKRVWFNRLPASPLIGLVNHLLLNDVWFAHRFPVFLLSLLKLDVSLLPDTAHIIACASIPRISFKTPFSETSLNSRFLTQNFIFVFLLILFSPWS